ncbi:MAG: hypothetical protein ACD_62C00600G0005 [uncultured bacterium]|nr:MAG: hypothetical protein ACD_62C00600G0005 [uncultured bacterium]HLD45770.1 hypothetical protein [bacterium]
MKRSIVGFMVIVLCVVASCSVFTNKDKDEVKINLPGVSIETKGDDAKVKLPGLDIKTEADKTEVNLPGMTIKTDESSATGEDKDTEKEAPEQPSTLKVETDKDGQAQTMTINSDGKTIQIKVDEKNGIVQIPGMNIQVSKDGSVVTTQPTDNVPQQPVVEIKNAEEAGSADEEAVEE